MSHQPPKESKEEPVRTAKTEEDRAAENTRYDAPRFLSSIEDSAYTC